MELNDEDPVPKFIVTDTVELRDVDELTLAAVGDSDLEIVGVGAVWAGSILQQRIIKATARSICGCGENILVTDRSWALRSK